MTAALWHLRAARGGDERVIASHRYFKPKEQLADLEAYASWVESALIAGNYIGTLACDANGIVVGGGGLTLLDWGPSRGSTACMRARIVNVFTDEAWRRRGIAKAVVSQLLLVCSGKRIQRVSLSFTDSSRPLYESLGFTVQYTEMALKVP